MLFISCSHQQAVQRELSQGRCWRVTGYSHSPVLIRLRGKYPHARRCSFLELPFSWKLCDAFCLRVIKERPRRMGRGWELGI